MPSGTREALRGPLRPASCTLFRGSNARRRNPVVRTSARRTHAPETVRRHLSASVEAAFLRHNDASCARHGHLRTGTNTGAEWPGEDTPGSALGLSGSLIDANRHCGRAADPGTVEANSRER
jgi:hypothetical protein